MRMADLRIVDAPVLLQESITDDVKMPTGGLGNFSVRLGDILWYVITKEQLANKNYVDLSSKSVKDSLDEHIADKANPHQVTKAQVGLGNVDNTADVDKPVSNAVRSAIITATTDMATKTYVNSKDGDLTTLTTTDKTSLVKAINEIHDVTKGVVALYDKNVEAGANGWTAELILDKSGETQQQVNYNGGSKWYSRVGGYQENERVVLANGDIVKSTIDGNTNDPNVDMTGWVNQTDFTVVSPEMFGRTGTANDTSVFLKALNYANSMGGGILELKGKIYNVEPLDLRGYNNIEIRGTVSQQFPYLNRTVLKIISDAEIAIQTVAYGEENSQNYGRAIKLKNIFINCNGMTDYGVTCKLATELEGCSFRNARLDGIVLVGTSYPVNIKNCASLSNGRRGLYIKAPNTTVYFIDGLECGFNGEYGALIEDGSTSNIKGLLCQSNAVGGLKIKQRPTSDFTLPIFLERLAFDGFYAEANGTIDPSDPRYEGNFGLVIEGRNNDITTQSGKISDLSFKNSSVNSIAGGGTSSISGTSNLLIETSTGIAVDPTKNIIGEYIPQGLRFPDVRPTYDSLPNTLDWYRAGARGLTLSVASGSISLLTPIVARFAMVGDVVTFSFAINVSSVSTPSGELTITGIPYNFATTTAFSVYSNFLLGNDVNIQAHGLEGGNSIIVRGYSNGLAGFVSQYLKEGSVIEIAGSYFAAGRSLP